MTTITPAPPARAALELGLSTVLATALPESLGTADAPERYTVSAVFTRKPTAFELQGIGSAETVDALAAAGYADVGLTVSDRRLEIGNTSLEQLRDGLARAIALRFAAIGAAARTREGELLEAARESSEHEHERAVVIAELVASVRFDAGERPAAR